MSTCRYGHLFVPRHNSGYGGVAHTVEVTVASLYEAVAQGLASFRGNEWIADIGERFGVVKVSIAEVRVEHEVKLKDFTPAWKDRGRSPREIIHGQKVCVGAASSR